MEHGESVPEIGPCLGRRVPENTNTIVLPLAAEGCWDIGAIYFPGVPQQGGGKSCAASFTNIYASGTVLGRLYVLHTP